MRLAYFLGTFPALTETFVLGEIEALRAIGMEPDLYALRRPAGTHALSLGTDLAARTYYSPGWLSREMWAANLAALRRAPGRYLRTLGSILLGTALNPVHCVKSLGIFPVAAAFAERMRARGITHVHAHWATYPATAGYVASRLLDITFSFTAHVYDAILVRSLMRQKIRRARFVVTCTRWNAERIAHRMPGARDKVVVNYHGATLERFVPNGHHPPRPRFSILSCGSLYPRKGFPVLIEACRQLRDRGVAFDCTIVGEGPMRGDLEALIARHRLGDRVRLAGALPQPEVIAHYRAADLFVMPCVTDFLGWDEIRTEPVLLLEVGPAIPFRPLTDGIPNVLVEAMAMRLPVLSTYVAGIPELIENGRNGVLVPEQDPAALAAAIQRLIGDPDLRRDLGERGRQTVLERFDRARNIQELVALFSERAGSTSAPPGARALAGAHDR
jgi:glycosyltransferase involved in cell wall biosynthesis